MAHIEVVDDDIEAEDYGAVLDEEPPRNEEAPPHNSQRSHYSRRAPPPSRWKRAGLWSLFCLVFWLAYTMRKHLDQPLNAAHARRCVGVFYLSTAVAVLYSPSLCSTPQPRSLCSAPQPRLTRILLIVARASSSS
ncbi:uncharacterized protein SCHCODRAFT_02700940 [Schizophyllum commune H4-8]|nr:uncharacterized protein SCHCODRAFT_02700940 [Schizophyllum commune H4-8]KAI5891874.1 hypothetical protein SCHCODRAFT_02700940 [Schizophyllum commune H4-8]